MGYFDPEITILLVGSLLLAIAGLYFAALPKPLSGIPYDHKSARRLLGDLPDVLRYGARYGENFTFFAEKCEELGSPIIQLFLKPFRRPFVVVSDSREVFDILHRRGKEFDQSDLFRHNLIAPWQHSTPTMRAGEQWSYNRRLVSETMSPAFLRDVDAPISHELSRDLIKLWQHKARLAQGRAFSVEKDLNRITSDIIWKVMLGEDVGAVRSSIQMLASIEDTPLPSSEDEIVQMPEGAAPKVFTAFGLLADSSTLPRTSPFGHWHHMFAVRFYPQLSWAFRLRNAVVKKQARDAWATFKDSDLADKRKATSAVEFVIQREVRQAKREGRAPEGPSKWLEGELALMLAAGFDTTASSMAWALKYLTAFQEIQEKIRSILHEAFSQALAEKRHPSALEVYNTPVLYLDAFIEEVLRCCRLVPGVSRTAITNTQVLGHDIAAGTTVVLFLSPQHRPHRAVPRPQAPSSPKPVDVSIPPVSESLRTSSGKEYSQFTTAWDAQANDLQLFRPERYLRRDKDGAEHLDLMAAPHVAFGGGTRGCFGKRMAYLNMRMMLTLIVWSLDLLPVQDDFAPLEQNTIVPKEVVVRLREAKV